ILLTAAARSGAVTRAIARAAATLARGDMLLLTYSGHGGQIPDTNHDEADRQDETWVLYDRELIDDEIYSLWARFKPGVRIVVLSDSCHSGTVSRDMATIRRANAGQGFPKRQRFMPPDVALKTYKRHRKLYDGIQAATPGSEKTVVRAAVILISGCQDNQTSSDGDRNGLFTGKLRKVWAGGKRFKGGYRTLRDRISALMPRIQSPNYYRVGAVNAAFERQKPFTL
ncbi:MAG TPA: caspase family protein, partial [Patescibacteria group bacterium]|nr:caspase family protein [Patescibacteria group bacterium]